VSSFAEEPLQVDAFLPEEEEPVSAEQALAELEQALEDAPDEADLVVGAPPPPIGRSWAFDWQLRNFARGHGHRGPQPTRDEATLQQWIIKALRTARGAHPVAPELYGLPQASIEGMIGGPAGVVPPDLEQRVSETLLEHPRITEVRDFVYAHDPNDDRLFVSFTYELDGGQEEATVEGLEVVV
jgi:hypothetical protein